MQHWTQVYPDYNQVVTMDIMLKPLPDMQNEDQTPNNNNNNNTLLWPQEFTLPLVSILNSTILSLDLALADPIIKIKVGVRITQISYSLILIGIKDQEVFYWHVTTDNLRDKCLLVEDVAAWWLEHRTLEGLVMARVILLSSWARHYTPNFHTLNFWSINLISHCRAWN